MKQTDYNEEEEKELKNILKSLEEDKTFNLNDLDQRNIKKNENKSSIFELIQSLETNTFVFNCFSQNSSNNKNESNFIENEILG